MCVFFFGFVISVLSFRNYLAEEERAGCLALIWPCSPVECSPWCCGVGLWPVFVVFPGQTHMVKTIW